MSHPEPGLMAQLLGRLAYGFAQVQPILPMELHLIVSALFPIYIGAHASLSRPSSAAKPPKRKPARSDGSHREEEEDSDDDDDGEEERIMEGLSPKDALLMPLFAGCALASLYFILMWMKDAALLNKILNAYYAIFGVFSVSRLVTDALDTGHSIIFPHRYVLDGTLYHVNTSTEKAEPVAGKTTKALITSPLPGFLARLPLSRGVREMLWADRTMPGRKWTLRMYLDRILASRFKIGPHDIVGIVAGLSTVLYFNLVNKPWYLTNLLGFGFSYSALQLMSPTNFATGSLMLVVLFFYDIYFVFFTPMMVTVAKSLDVPIKLMFPRPASAEDPSAKPSHAMLGLGDIVLPGIVIGLALRFDLYLFYLRQQRRTRAATHSGADIIEKPQYHSLAGRWTDYFWTHSLTGRPLWATATAENSKLEVFFTFPKTYFKASLVGYVLGMLVTTCVMIFWDHAQPALLYLVPGVLGSLWLTALARGELNLMWNYTEAIEDEKQGKMKSDESANATQNQANGMWTRKPCADSKSTDHTQLAKRMARRHPEGEIFSFSIQRPMKQSRSVHKDGQSAQLATDSTTNKSGEYKWAPSKLVADTEPAGKRVRLN